MSLERNPEQIYPDEPEWLRFKWEFFTDTKKTKRGRGSNTKVREFEKLHPNLELIDVMDISKNIMVFRGPVLFRADGKEYREIKYSYKREGQLRYYQPSTDLLDWFDCVDQFSQYRKLKKEERK